MVYNPNKTNRTCVFIRIFINLLQNTANYIDEDEWFNSFFEDPVLNDKMITDAAQPPRINSEHSYSSINDSLGSSELNDDGKLEGMRL